MKLIRNIRSLYIVFAITVLVSFISILDLYSTPFKAIGYISSGLMLFWYYVFYVKSSIKKTRYFNIILLFIAVFLLGLLFKLFHWSGTGVLLFVGIVGIAITYLVWFLTKRSKIILDFIKIVWLFTTLFVVLGMLEHFVRRDFVIIPNVLFLVLIGTLLVQEKNRILQIK